jgi:NAD(P)-dependent dehydrogenase (short-subunit alcohol dehydrogenase family)
VKLKIGFLKTKSLPRKKEEPMNLNLEGKVVIVTGAARGIGRATALAFCREGAKVVIDDIDLEAAIPVEEEAKSSGAQAIAIKADVTKPDEVKQMVKETLDKLGRIDILVNNAGILYMKGKRWPEVKSFQESTEEDWAGFINITLYGVLNCSKAVLEIMLSQKSGNIINIGSYASNAPRGSRANTYSAGKGGIISFTRNLAYEVGPSGIRVNCISPGITRTTRMEAIEAGEATDEESANFHQDMAGAVQRTPMRRIGTPQDLANAVVFLASDASSYVTGQTLHVNGGLYMS